MNHTSLMNLLAQKAILNFQVPIQKRKRINPRKNKITSIIWGCEYYQKPLHFLQNANRTRGWNWIKKKIKHQLIRLSQPNNKIINIGKKSKRKRKLEIWDEFAEIKDDKGVVLKLQCPYCDKTYSPKTSSSLLKPHLEACKKKNEEKIKSRDQLITNFLDKKSFFLEWDCKWINNEIYSF